MLHALSERHDMRPLYKAIVVGWALLLLLGCTESTYWYLTGPASLHVDNTMYTPGADVDIEEGGKMFRGPDMPEFYLNEAADELAETEPEDDTE